MTFDREKLPSYTPQSKFVISVSYFLLKNNEPIEICRGTSAGRIESVAKIQRRLAAKSIYWGVLHSVCFCIGIGFGTKILEIKFWKWNHLFDQSFVIAPISRLNQRQSNRLQSIFDATSHEYQIGWKKRLKLILSGWRQPQFKLAKGFKPFIRQSHSRTARFDAQLPVDAV